MSDPHEPGDEEGPGSRFRRFGRRILGEGEGTGRFSARDVVGAVLEGGDKAKTEVVRVVAREVRTYLEELGLREVLTDYSLEVHASINLRRLSEAEKAPRAEPLDRRRSSAPARGEAPEPKREPAAASGDEADDEDAP